MMNTSSSSVADVLATHPVTPPSMMPGAGVLCRPAEEAFKKGIAALNRSETTVARALFEAAMQIERESGSGRVQPRFLSYYGLTLMEHPEKLGRARDCCRRAVKDEFFNPDLFLNLSKVHLKLGERGEAYRTAARGLALDPRHTGLTQHIEALGTRKRPPLRFLDRSSTLNVLLGKLLRRRRSRSH